MNSVKKYYRNSGSNTEKEIPRGSLGGIPKGILDKSSEEDLLGHLLRIAEENPMEISG